MSKRSNNNNKKKKRKQKHAAIKSVENEIRQEKDIAEGNNSGSTIDVISKQYDDPSMFSLTSAIHGNIYQLKLLMLFLFRGLKKEYSFLLATEMIAAEKFDDLIFMYENEKKDGNIYRFLQAKHKLNECTKITAKDLFIEKGPFYLEKYFKSYSKIKQNPLFNKKNSELKDFVICTNIDFEECLQINFSQIENENDIFDMKHSSRKESKRLKLKEGNFPLRQQIISNFKNASVLNKLAKILVECVTNQKQIQLNDELFCQYNGILTENVIDIENSKFHNNFLNGNQKELENFRNAFFEAYLKQSKNQVNVAAFWQEMRVKKLQISPNFKNNLNINVKLSADEIKRLVNAILTVIGNASDDNIVNINMKKLKGNTIIIQDNIGLLMRFVLTQNNDNENKDLYYFNSAFFINTKKLPGNLSDFSNKLRTELDNSVVNKYKYKFYIANVWQKYGVGSGAAASLPNDYVDDMEIESFLKKLVFAVNQPNEIELGEIIKNELGEAFNQIDKNNIYGRFLEKMLDWMKTRDGKFMSHDDGKLIFDELKKEILGNIWFNMKDPIRLFSGRKDELNLLHKTVQRSLANGGTSGGGGAAAIVSQITTVSGLGGIGKSELVRKYAQQYSEHYDSNVLWMNAENYDTLTVSFCELAADHRLGIPTKDINNNNKSIDTIVKEIYAFFGKKKCLFIFDSVDKKYDLNKFLPLQSLAPNTKKPYILITSRMQEWERGIDVIKLNGLKLNDAIDFVKNGLAIPEADKLQDDAVESLVNELQCFPLAIQQSIAYIIEQNFTGEFKIADYLKTYKQKKKHLLDSDAFQGIDNDYTKTTLNTWQISIDTVTSDKQNGPLAIKILNYIAYFAPENINRNIFLSLVANGNEERLKLAVRLLIKYSMINGEHHQSLLSVHGLVQEVIRINIKKGKIEQKILEEIYELFKKCYPYLSEKSEDYANRRKLLPHLEVFLLHIDSWLVRHPENKQKMEENYLEYMLKWMGEGYLYLGEPRNCETILKRLLKIKQKHYGHEHIDVAKTLTNIGMIVGKLGDLQEGKLLLEKSLKIHQKHYGHNHPELCATLLHLGLTYGQLGDRQKQIKLIEMGLKIHVEYFGIDNIRVAKFMSSLADAYAHFGDPVKQQFYAQSAVNAMEKHCGSDSFELATALLSLGVAYRNLGERKKHKDLTERALHIQEKYYGINNFNICGTLLELGVAYYNLDNPHKQRDLTERALHILEKYYGPDHFEVCGAIANLAKIYVILGDTEKQKSFLERALQILYKHSDTDHIVVARRLLSIGDTYGRLGNHQKNKELSERALNLLQKQFGADHIELVPALENLGDIHNILCDYQKSKKFFEQVLKIKQKYYGGSDHFQVDKTLVATRRTDNEVATIITLSQQSACGSAAGEHEEKKELLQQAVKIPKKHCDGADADADADAYNKVAKILENLSQAYGGTGEHKKKIELLERQLKIQEKHFGAEHFEMAKTYLNLAAAYWDLGDYEKNKILLERVLSIVEKEWGSDHIQVASILTHLDRVYDKLGAPQKQKESLERAVNIIRNHFGPESINLYTILFNLSIAYDALGDYQKQKEVLDQSLTIQEKHFGADNLSIVKTLLLLAEAVGKLGNLREKKNLLKRVLRIQEKNFVGRSFNVTELYVTLCKLGNAYTDLGEPEKKDKLDKSFFKKLLSNK